jgi:hypothetical protein
MKPTARFKESINGSDVVIELRPGQTLTHVKYKPTDEGWDRTVHSWFYDADTKIITATYFNEGRDCDGYMSSYHDRHCPLDMLQAKTVKHCTGGRWESFTDYDGTKAFAWVDDWQEQTGWPNWQDGGSEYYDENAHAMGY